MEMHNLRFDESGAMRPVGAPSVISEYPWGGLAYLPGGNGMVTEFVAAGRKLGVAVYPMNAVAADPVEIGTLWFDPIGAIETDGGYLIIGEGAKAVVTADETGLLRVSNPDVSLPEATVEVGSPVEVTVNLPSVNITGSYDSRSTQLTASDQDAITKMMGDKYCSASEECGRAGLFIQAVMTRYNYIDVKGKVVVRSPPVWHTCLSGDSVPAASRIKLQPGQTAGSKLTLEAYRMYLRLPKCQKGIEAYERIARIDVEMSPQIHVYEPAAGAVARLSTPAGGVTEALVSVPGCSLPAEGYRRKMVSAVEADDSLFEVVCSIPYPFRGRDEEELIEIYPRRLSVRDEIALLDKWGGRVGKRTGDIEPRLLCPHRISPRAIAGGTDVTLAGNLSVELFKGHSLDYFTHERGAVDLVESVVSVELEGGRRRVVNHSVESDTKIAKTISPLFAYPDPTATSATFMTMGADGNCRKLTVPLTPAGNFAYWISPTLKPVELPPAPEGEEFYVPATVGERVDYPGCLITARHGYPLEPLSAIRLGGDILGIHPAPRPASSSWESGSPRYIVVGSGGIWSVGVSSAGRISRPTLLDGRPVSGSGGGAVASEGSEGSRLYVIAGGDLVAVSSNKVRTIRRRTGSVKPVWSSSYGELCLIVPGEDKADVYTPASGLWSTRTLHAITDVMSTPGASRLTSSADGYLDLNTELHTSVYCSLSGELSLPKRRHPFRPPATAVGEVIADMTGSAVSGTLDILGSHGSTAYATLSRVAFNGEIYAPIVHRVFLPYRYKVCWRLDGLMSHDTRIYSIFHTPLSLRL